MIDDLECFCDDRFRPELLRLDISRMPSARLNAALSKLRGVDTLQVVADRAFSLDAPIDCRHLIVHHLTGIRATLDASALRGMPRLESVVMSDAQAGHFEDDDSDDPDYSDEEDEEE